jgi:2-phospho-L-lactate guanylyltransferase
MVPTPAPHPAAGSWRLVLPVKGGAAAKSRLVPPGGVSRRALAEALALDALAAVLSCPQVACAFVVTADAQLAATVTAIGAGTLSDPGGGLDAAVSAGIAGVLDRLGDGPIAVLLPDLPALTPGELTSALVACAAYDAAYVPDSEGTGTVLLAGRRAADLHPAFGAHSAARHAIHAHRLDLDLPGLRRDVDVAAALATAITLGVGSRTAAALAATAG